MSKQNGINTLDVVVLMAVIVVALVSLPQPFMGDQAINTIIAEKMSQGEVLYRDVWDLKHPGIFGFLFVAGSLFGFNEIGIHLFELLYMLAFSVVSIFA
ncbi:MAG: hypothetical protein KDD84_20680, partial [Caldilineaceae bacterium]|nr:hypothetical protein [Caldilineaceae bacterium]